CQQSNDDPRTF
nr:immunoglobulin light chain junction region [Mus musculus]NSM00123.1 immunoglobulin light chain junction region [Mus musculus]NSM00275.1 immunoglobulin light chain junction region [Mus musculus]NSM00397.1 immunoglobulin light chain junction region [Mus musculus]NSM00781.1 immunoglobulin light chain junction region [Mus musculus]